MKKINNDLEIYPMKIPDTDIKKLSTPVPYPLPDIENGAVVIIVAKRGTGKTTLLSNLVLRESMLNCKDNMDYCFFCSNTIHQDKTAQHIKKEYEATCYDKYSDQIIKDIISFQKSFGEDKASIPRTLICLDDCLGSVKKNSTINFLASRSRHLLNGGLLIFSTQTLKSLSTVVRTNCTQVILMKTTNKKEIEKFYEEFGGIFGNQNQFDTAFNYCTDGRFDFCYINFDLGLPKMFKNFTEDVTDKFFPHINQSYISKYNLIDEKNNINN